LVSSSGNQKQAIKEFFSRSISTLSLVWNIIELFKIREKNISLKKGKKHFGRMKDFQNVGFFWFPKHGNGFQNTETKNKQFNEFFSRSILTLSLVLM
jgi:hypothetical protein